MDDRLSCPQCGARTRELRDYESLMVLSADTALFTVLCEGCGAHVSAVRPIPASMSEEVHFAAIEIGAGMGLEY